MNKNWNICYERLPPHIHTTHAMSRHKNTQWNGVSLIHHYLLHPSYMGPTKFYSIGEPKAEPDPILCMGLENLGLGRIQINPHGLKFFQIAYVSTKYGSARFRSTRISRSFSF